MERRQTMKNKKKCHLENRRKPSWKLFPADADKNRHHPRAGSRAHWLRRSNTSTIWGGRDISPRRVSYQDDGAVSLYSCWSVPGRKRLHKWSNRDIKKDLWKKMMVQAGISFFLRSATAGKCRSQRSEYFSLPFTGGRDIMFAQDVRSRWSGNICPSATAAAKNWIGEVIWKRKWSIPGYAHNR